MAKYFDKDGAEVEAFSEEELVEKNKEAIAEYLVANPDKSDALKTATDALAVAEGKIKEAEEAGGGEGSEEQKKRLLSEKNDATKALEELKTSFTKEIGELKDGFFGSAKTKIIGKLAGDDVELKAKIELEYDKFKGDPANEVEIQERMANAFTLATGNSPAPNFMDGVSGASVKGVEQPHESKAPETDNSKNMRNAFGISDADAEKHGGPDANVNVK